MLLGRLGFSVTLIIYGVALDCPERGKRMVTTDRFDLPLTSASAAAVADYIAAVDLLLSANTGADA